MLWARAHDGPKGNQLLSSSIIRIKTFLRSRMISCRLNNVFFLYIHQHLTDSLDMVAMGRQFVSSNTRRQNYFGKF